MNKEERAAYNKAWYKKNGRKRNLEVARERMRKMREDPKYRKRQAVYYKDWYRRGGRKRSPNYTDVIIAWNKAHPDARKATSQVAEAIKKGLLVRLPNCIGCGRQTRVHAHHEDYSKPFEVMWLCASCHKKIHQSA